jgi:glycosyltransferase involved in cell wall biosynthesis
VKENLISCIVPVYNSERYLGETLDSILAQTYRPLEIIVVDDGSTDGTAAVAAGYGHRVRYVRQANAGEAAARNRGLNVAEGEFVAFDDADDLWHPEKLERQVARLEHRPEIDLSFTSFENFWIPELAEEELRFRSGVRAWWGVDENGEILDLPPTAFYESLLPTLKARLDQQRRRREP